MTGPQNANGWYQAGYRDGLADAAAEAEERAHDAVLEAAEAVKQERAS